MTQTCSLWAFVRFTHISFQYVSLLNFTIQVNQEKCLHYFFLDLLYIVKHQICACFFFFFTFELHCEAHSLVLKNTEAKMLINNAAKECYRNKFYSNIWLKVLWMFVGVCKFISTYNLMYICLYQRATVFFL